VSWVDYMREHGAEEYELWERLMRNKPIPGRHSEIDSGEQPQRRPSLAERRTITTPSSDGGSSAAGAVKSSDHLEAGSTPAKEKA
jgi:hypothetical protein